MDLAAALRKRPLAIVASSRYSASISNHRALLELFRSTQPECDEAEHTCRSWLLGKRVQRLLGDGLGVQLAEALHGPVSTELETMANLPIDLILTTSMGDGWENALASAGKMVCSVAPGQTPDYDYDAVVYHLLGKADQPETLVLSGADLERNLATTNLGDLLQGWWASRVFLFVGFTMDDPELEVVLQRLVPEGQQHDHFIHLPDATLVEETEIAEQFGISVVGHELSANALVELLHGGAALVARERVDLDSLVARASADPSDPSVAAGFELLEHRLRREGDYERIIDVNVARLALSDDEVERRQILLETAALLEDKMADRQRAFEATLSAYRECPDNLLWPVLTRRAAEPDEKRRLAEAICELRASLPTASRVPALLQAVAILREVGDTEHATELLELTSADKREHPELAQVHRDLLREGERWQDLERALSECADSSDYLEERERFLLQRADILHKRIGEPWAAIECYQQVLVLNPTNGRAVEAVEALFLELHQVPALLDLLFDYGAHYRKSELQTKLWRLGERCRSRGDLAGAVLCYERLRDEQPSNGQILATLAELYSDLGETARHRDVLKAQMGSAEPGKARADLCQRLAHVHEELHQLDEAAECWEWVLHDRPESTAAFRALERLYRVSRRWPELLDLYSRRKAFVQGADLGGLLVSMADVYQHHLEDPARAIEICHEARRVDPARDLDGRLLKLLEGAGRFGEAAALADELAEAAESSPAHAVLLQHAGELWARHGNLDRAADRLAEACKKNPGQATQHGKLGEIYRAHDKLLRAGEELELASRFAAGAEATRWALASAQCYEGAFAEDRAIAVLESRTEAGAKDSILRVELRRLYERNNRYVELLDLLESEPEGKRSEERLERLWAMAEAHRALGQWHEEITCCERAVELYPDRLEVVRRLAETAVAHKSWDAVEHACRLLLKLEGRPEDAASAYCMLAEREADLGNVEAAIKLLGKARDKVPFDRRALTLLTDLSEGQPEAQMGYLRALLLDAPESERADLLIRIGDLCSLELEQRSDARDAYQEALLLREHDHLLLHRCLAISVEDGEWYESLEYLERLIETEKDPSVRARYRATAARVHEEELSDIAPAIPLLWDAVEDDPANQDNLRLLARHLRAHRDWQGLLECTSRLLAALRDDRTVPAAVHARAWQELAEVCIKELSDRETAICALEVAVNLQPFNLDYRVELARLYSQEEGRLEDAIAQHQAILDLEPHRQHSYQALSRLYEKLGWSESAEACQHASAVMRGEKLKPASRALNRSQVLTLERFTGLCHPDDRLAMGQLMALLTPAIAAVVPRRRRRGSTHGQRRLVPDTHLVTAKVKRIAKRLGVFAPVVYLEPVAKEPVQVGLELREGELIPSIVLNDKTLAELDETRTTFLLASAVAAARREYLVLAVEPDAQVLGQTLDAVIELARKSEAQSKTAKALGRLINPVALDQVRQLLDKLSFGERSGVEIIRSWSAASALTANRIGLWVTGDLGAALQGLEARVAPTEDRDLARQDLIRAYCSAGMREEAPPQRVPATPLRTLAHKAQQSGQAPVAQENKNPAAMRERFRLAAQNVTEELQLEALLL